MITLNNGKIECKIAKRGAEVKSIVKDGREYIWEADPKFWAGSAPILFPICGGLKQDTYVYDGAEYQLPKHGFAPKSEFEVESMTDDTATLVLRDNEATRAAYPFSFALKVTFRLVGDTLETVYTVENTDQKTLYCSIGAHEAYATPEGIEAYDIIFPEKETLYSYALNGNILTDYTKLIMEDSHVLPLKDEYFYLDALVFRDLKSRSAILRHRESGREVKVEFPEFDYFLLWHKYTAPYICLEPWCGIPDVAGSSYEISEKEGIQAVPAGEKLVRVHTISL